MQVKYACLDDVWKGKSFRLRDTLVTRNYENALKERRIFLKIGIYSNNTLASFLIFGKSVQLFTQTKSSLH